MDGNVSNPNSPFRNLSLFGNATNWDFLDELLYQETSQSTIIFEPSLPMPSATSNLNLNIYYDPEETERFPMEITELDSGRRVSEPVIDRLLKALEYLKDGSKDRDVLIQIWMPVNKGGRNFLTTIDQLFFVSSDCKNLEFYRKAVQGYQFSLEGNIGFPGRVFLEKLPDWSGDVRLFRDDEYPFGIQASKYKISGCIAVPVLEPNSGACLGVVEVVTVADWKMNYRSELEDVCNALEAVDLKSSVDFCRPGLKVINEFYQVAIHEISEILQHVCHKYGLPLAITWAPCNRQGKSGNDELFAEKYSSCISTVDPACLLANVDFSGFYKACFENYIFLGQGIVGRAFSKQKQCFSADITEMRSDPLSHHARNFDLHAAIAFPLRDVYTGSVEFCLELFLPEKHRGIQEQRRLWDVLSVSIQKRCRSLSIILDKDELVAESFDSNSSWIARMMEAQRNGNGCCVSLDSKSEEPEEEFKMIISWDDSKSELRQLQKTSRLPKNYRIDGDVASSTRTTRRKQRRKTGEKKRISLEVLRQHFAGSLQDAAKNIGVCPTTLKRICRKNGIARWPSRKIKKVDHSLRKLQKVIDSVQGNESSIEISSFYSAFPALSSSKYSNNDELLVESVDDLKQSNPRPESPDTKSHSSSCSKDSCVTTCCSARSKKHSRNMNDSSEVEFKKQELNIPARSLVHETLSKRDSNPVNPAPCSVFKNSQSSQDEWPFRIKAILGDEKIRLCMQPSWKLSELKQEMANRFQIDDLTGIDLKYLDDDEEWVRLNSDADLEECKQIYRYSPSNSIKIWLIR
ncbi:protein NLP2-like [Mercurialis annua]|uniref:protein NLP2-like n=1 Tax=Mercurialis annua TaxID=3986 RepID=UPI00215F8C1E|nr:protein NLP2-like [Mercurialis annua]